MDKVSAYIVANTFGGYNVIPKTTQTANAKHFVIPTEELAAEKITQPYKVTQKVGLIRPITYIGYDNFDPFNDMATTGSFSIPKYMQTKTKPTRSDAEILKEIQELAKEHAKTGLNRNDDERFKKLIDEYVSSVSPDRAGILKSKMGEIQKRLEFEKSAKAKSIDDMGHNNKNDDKENEKELIDYLMDSLKYNEKYSAIISCNLATRGNNIASQFNDIIATHTNGNFTQYDINRGEGNITSLIYDNSIGELVGMALKGDMYDNVLVENDTVKSANFYDSNGEMIMSYYSNNGALGGLLQAYTEAEGARLEKLFKTYNAAYDLAKAA